MYSPSLSIIDKLKGYKLETFQQSLTTSTCVQFWYADNKVLANLYRFLLISVFGCTTVRSGRFVRTKLWAGESLNNKKINNLIKISWNINY